MLSKVRPNFSVSTELQNLHQTHERRQRQSNVDSCYERLTFAQKVAASHLIQFGFTLKFIRGKTFDSLAIFTCDSLIATVDYFGEIDTTVNVSFR